jgi:hypothetical protein
MIIILLNFFTFFNNNELLTYIIKVDVKMYTENVDNLTLISSNNIKILSFTSRDTIIISSI